MMKLKIFQVDAFTTETFGGNPACVVPMTSWPEDKILLNIAKENAVAETAFYIPKDEGYQLRWFTPDIEMDLCGHATLAAAHVLIEHMGYQEDNISFYTLSGKLSVVYHSGTYTLDFPSRKPHPAELPEIIRLSIDTAPVEVLKDRDFILVYASEEEVRNIKVDRMILDQINLDPGGIVITAAGKNCDFVSRFFTPQSTIFEDPVTGSSHCSLIPYWSERLNKKELTAMQLSERLGKLDCIDLGERVLISGNAKTYLEGFIYI